MLSSYAPHAEQDALPSVASEEMPFHRQLRAATRPCHDAVDSRYARFDLSDRASYVAFLCAHARALLPLEAWLEPATFSPLLGSRADALVADLAGLGEAPPAFAPLDWPRSDAARWGAAYVIEGSRLGGALLSRSVPAILPSSYLSAVHGHGGWRAILAELDRLAARGGPGWQAEAVAAAERSFAIFARAAHDVGVSGAV